MGLDGVRGTHGGPEGPGWLKWAPPDSLAKTNVRNKTLKKKKRRQRLILDADSPEPEVLA